jgi:hypothetical protein
MHSISRTLQNRLNHNQQGYTNCQICAVSLKIYWHDCYGTYEYVVQLTNHTVSSMQTKI